ncbi:acyltransferase [Acidocella sp.]|uniref:acyltransferase family protein n=1 Tax=Acidocella sp. TaxID=50710 RepID=UPI0026184724|nr:acyltransferase [Acidocella sp.]
MEPRRYLTLETSRFVAAFFVVCGHLANFIPIVAHHPVPRAFNLPQIISVLFFFVLSGFVIETAHGRDAGNPRRILRYGWRRFCRLFPLYWLSLLVPLYFLLRVSSPGYLLQILTLSPFSSPHLPELNPPAWSLRFELVYYLMFGLLLVRRLRRPLLWSWAGLILLHWLMQIFDLFHLLPSLPFAANLNGTAMRFLGVHSFLFLSGMAAARLRTSCRWRAASLWWLLGAAAMVMALLLPAQNWGYGYPPGWLEPFTGLLMGAMIFAVTGLEDRLRLRPPGWTAWLGAMSYPLYLMHASIILIVGVQITLLHHHCPPPVSLFGLMLGAVLILATAAMLIDRQIQRSCRKWV